MSDFVPLPTRIYENTVKKLDDQAKKIAQLQAVIKKHRPRMCSNYPTEATMPSEEESDEWGCNCPHCEMGRALDDEPEMPPVDQTWVAGYGPVDGEP